MTSTTGSPGPGERGVVESLLAKLREQVDRSRHLVGLLPPGSGGWAPALPGTPFTVAVLLGHLLECLAGVCAVLHRARPGPLSHFARLRERPVNHACSPGEALDRMSEYLACIEEGFGLLGDRDLAECLPTLFVPEGETVALLLLGNLEHLINHKFQLFSYLKMMGVPVASADLYVFRTGR